ncbi:hypothetical protein [Vibrio coralliilyticus]|uniref:hypothetical protein n=1 Tax=Vibrio coralliilyticus TaxID=190893 RepID=UPI000C164DD2|nr:hypothetical protein [Vibrio coralliilyticus]
MKLNHSAIKRNVYAANMYFKLTVGYVMLVSMGMFYIFFVKDLGENAFKIFSALSFTTSAIALMTTSYANAAKSEHSAAHTISKYEDGATSLIIYNTCEQDLNIHTIFYHQWYLHESFKQLIKIKSNDYVEIKLTENQASSKDHDYKLTLGTTVETIPSQYFEQKLVAGKQDTIAITIPKKKEPNKEEEKAPYSLPQTP